MDRISVRRYPLQDGDAGIARTVRYMYAFVAGNEGAANAQIRQKACDITRNVASHDRAGEIAAIFRWVKDNIRFRGEYKETLQTPVVTLQMGAGDCDDFSTLLASLLQSLGHKTRFKTVATRGQDFSHVYTEVLDPTTGSWTALDPTVPGAGVGWQVPNPTRSRTWAKPAGMAGLGDFYVTPTQPPPSVIIGGKTANTVAILNQLQPLLQAVGNRIQYGSNRVGAGFDLNINAGQPYPLGLQAPETQFLGAPISTWFVGAMFIVGAYALVSGKRR